ncbi:hypothetical protein POV27_00365 [Aureisphaera galaxeae]|uniref:hypothetical protein n=1 Tax=Aureisphaera galaxeae TaxID=1538023 RepID=UPI0023506B42|nr:hypothetical protein [Aureisphaera galaxeae]MDC8002489.1 hypothetical protein [Aureisphaera galaxeae]
MIVVHLFFGILVLGPIIWGINNVVRSRKEGKSKAGNLFWVLINSAVLYAIAYNLIFFFQELFLVLGKKYLGLTAYLYHNNHGWDGTHEMETLMQGTGAFGIFVMGLLFLGLLFFFRIKNAVWRLLHVWLLFHALVQSLYQVTVAYFAPESDVGQAFGYLKISGSWLMVFSIVSIIIMIGVCLWLSRFFLGYVREEERVSMGQRLRFFRFMVFGGALVGSLIVLLFRVPPWGQAVFPFLILLTVVPWIWAASGLPKKATYFPNRLNSSLQWKPLVFLIALLAVFRLILETGIEF